MVRDDNRRLGLLWWGRVGLLAVAAYWTARLASQADDSCALDLVNLVFHEAGHVLLRPFGETVHLLGGTLFQLAVPLALVVYFLWHRAQNFSAAFCCWWLGESLVDVAGYMADARDTELPLLGGYHDWNELFYGWNLLHESAVRKISSSTHALGTLLMLLGLAWMLFFLLPARWQSAIRERAPRALERVLAAAVLAIVS